MLLVIPPPNWFKLSGSPAAKAMEVLFGMFVISATAVAVCTELVPLTPVPLPGLLTTNRSRSPVTRPPGARIEFGDGAGGLGTVTVAVAPPPAAGTVILN